MIMKNTRLAIILLSLFVLANINLYSKREEKFTSVDKLPLNVVEVFDNMDSIGRWRTHSDAGAIITVSSVRGKIANALMISYDFTEGTWVGINKGKRADFSDKKGIRFFVRGEGNANNLEIKIEDRSGVTYGYIPDFKTNVGYWTSIEIEFESFEYWWGRVKEFKWGRIKNVSFAIAIKGDGEGGSGKVFIDQIELIEN